MGMLIFHVTTTDPAGAAYNLVQSVNQNTKHRARLLTTVPNAYGHPTDIAEIPDYGDEVEELLLSADVIHFHKINEDFEIAFNSKRPRRWRVKDFLTVNGKKKRVVYHVHGHPYERANVQENGELYKERNAVVLCSTPDLQEMYSPYCNARFFPNCVPVFDSKYLPRETDKMAQDVNGEKRWIVSHTVSDRNLKNCDMIEKAVNYVARTQPVNLMTIENTPFKMAMVWKRIAHVVFDHMQGYYGLSSLEGMAMGKPVIAGLNDHTIKSIMEFFDIGDIMPWQRPRDQSGLNDCLMDLIANPELRRVMGARGREFMEGVWNEKFIGGKLGELYESL